MLISVVSFGRLVLNEWLKLSKKKSFWFPFLIIAAFAGLLAYLLNAGLSKEPLTALGFAEECMKISGLGALTLYIVIIGTSGIVAREHSMGTIKFLLVRAHSRSKILASKYVAALLYMLLLAAFTLAASVAAGWLAFGFGPGAGASWGDVFAAAGYTLVYLFVYTTFTFMVGVLTKSAGATIGIGMFTVVMESAIVAALSRYSFSKYLLFTNTNLSVYEAKAVPVHGMTLTFSVTMLCLYVVLFLAAGFVTFKRRDIA